MLEQIKIYFYSHLKNKFLSLQGDEFLYYQNWGEQITEQSSTVLCVMDVETGTVSVLESVPENMSPGQVRKV